MWLLLFLQVPSIPVALCARGSLLAGSLAWPFLAGELPTPLVGFQHVQLLENVQRLEFGLLLRQRLVLEEGVVGVDLHVQLGFLLSVFLLLILILILSLVSVCASAQPFLLAPRVERELGQDLDLLRQRLQQRGGLQGRVGLVQRDLHFGDGLVRACTRVWDVDARMRRLQPRLARDELLEERARAGDSVLELEHGLHALLVVLQHQRRDLLLELLDGAFLLLQLAAQAPQLRLVLLVLGHESGHALDVLLQQPHQLLLAQRLRERGALLLGRLPFLLGDLALEFEFLALQVAVLPVDLQVALLDLLLDVVLLHARQVLGERAFLGQLVVLGLHALHLLLQRLAALLVQVALQDLLALREQLRHLRDVALERLLLAPALARLALQLLDEALLLLQDAFPHAQDLVAALEFAPQLGRALVVLDQHLDFAVQQCEQHGVLVLALLRELLVRLRDQLGRVLEDVFALAERLAHVLLLVLAVLDRLVVALQQLRVRVQSLLAQLDLPLQRADQAIVLPLYLLEVQVLEPDRLLQILLRFLLLLQLGH